MASQQEKVREYIDLLKAVNAKGLMLLEELPDLQLRSKHVIERLIASLAHAFSIKHEEGDEEELAPAERKPRTHMGGIALKQPAPKAKAIDVADLKPSDEDVNALLEMVALAFDDFQVMSPRELKETYEDSIIRALGAKMGMNVTPTEPKVIDFQFIGYLQDLVAKQAEKDNAVNTASKAAEELKQKEQKPADAAAPLADADKAPAVNANQPAASAASAEPAKAEANQEAKAAPAAASETKKADEKKK